MLSGGPNGFELEDLKLPDHRICLLISLLGDAIDLAILYAEAHGNRNPDHCSQMVRVQALEDRRV
jgi:hypothetical protein